MPDNNDATKLAEAVLDGRLTLEVALDEHLDGRYDGPVDDLYRVLGYANLGQTDRVLDLDGETLTVAEFVEEFGLAPFRPLLDQQGGFRFSIGDLVSYDGQAAQVIGRRAVTPFATPQFDDWELLIEVLESGTVGFVGEGEVEPDDEAADND